MSITLASFSLVSSERDAGWSEDLCGCGSLTTATGSPGLEDDAVDLSAPGQVGGVLHRVDFHLSGGEVVR